MFLKWVSPVNSAPISSSRSIAASALTPGLSRGGRNVESEPGPGRPCLVQTVTFPRSSANRKPLLETLRPMRRLGSPGPGHYLLFAALLPSPAGLRYQWTLPGLGQKPLSVKNLASRKHHHHGSPVTRHQAVGGSGRQNTCNKWLMPFTASD